MLDKEFYASILSKALIDAKAGIVIGGTDLEKIIQTMTESTCCKALREIREILNDDALDDRECFARIERVVSLFEDLGPGAGSRHDFG